MIELFPNLKSIVTAVFCCITILHINPAKAEVVPSDMSDAMLLTALAEAEVGSAVQYTRELESRWNKSGSATMDLLLRRGEDAWKRRDITQALQHFTALTDHAPDFAWAWSERARLYFVSGRFGQAAVDLEHALALNPNDYRSVFALGRLMEAIGRPERAYAAYTLVRSIHPHHEEVTKSLERLERFGQGQAL